MLKDLAKLFNQEVINEESISLVVTKDTDNKTITNVSEQLKEIIKADDIERSEKLVIKGLATSPEKISIFKTPTNVGKLGTKNKEEILNSIQETKPHKFKNIGVVISAEAKEKVGNVASELNEGCKASMKEISEKFENHIKKTEFKIPKLEQLKDKISKIEVNNSKLNQCAFEIVNELSQIVNELSLIKEIKLKSIFSTIEFCDFAKQFKPNIDQSLISEVKGLKDNITKILTSKIEEIKDKEKREQEMAVAMKEKELDAAYNLEKLKVFGEIAGKLVDTSSKIGTTIAESKFSSNNNTSTSSTNNNLPDTTSNNNSSTPPPKEDK
jgi:hypothetical protein